jgi:hypothetical protein
MSGEGLFGLVAGRWIFPERGAQRPIRAASGRFSLNRRQQKTPCFRMRFLCLFDAWPLMAGVLRAVSRLNKQR